MLFNFKYSHLVGSYCNTAYSLFKGMVEVYNISCFIPLIDINNL